MSIIAKIEAAIAVLNEVNELKAALGFDSSASITDIIAKIKSTTTELEGLIVTAPAATTTAAATSAAAGVTGA